MDGWMDGNSSGFWCKILVINLSGGTVPEVFSLLPEACPRVIMYIVWIRKIFMLMTRKVTGVCPSPWTCNTCVLSPTSGFSWLVERCKFIVVRSLPARYRSSETSTTTKGEETDVPSSREKFQVLVVTVPYRSTLTGDYFKDFSFHSYLVWRECLEEMCVWCVGLL